MYQLGVILKIGKPVSSFMSTTVNHLSNGLDRKGKLQLTNSERFNKPKSN